MNYQILGVTLPSTCHAVVMHVRWGLGLGRIGVLLGLDERRKLTNSLKKIHVQIEKKFEKVEKLKFSKKRFRDILT